MSMSAFKVPYGLLVVLALLEILRGYELLYGGIVGQKVENTDLAHEDVSRALEVALKAVPQCVEENSRPYVELMRKMRLYYSLDDKVPVIIHHRVVTSNKKTQIHRLQVVLGLLYFFRVVWPNSECPLIAYNFTVTRDRNKEYHLYRLTYSHANLHPAPNLPNTNCTCTPTGKRDTSHSRYATYMYRYTSQTDTQMLFGLENGLDFSHEENWVHHYSKAYWKIQQTHAFPSWFGLLQSCSCENCYPSVLRIATYNIWNLNGLQWEAYQHRLARLGKLISSQNVEIFGFQEVRLLSALEPSTSQCQVSQLSQYLPGYQYVFQPAMVYMDQLYERMEEGVGIFSRYPILSSNYILLYKNYSAPNDIHQRICLHAEVLTPHGRLHIFVTHLSLNRNSQERSVVQIWKYMSKFSGMKLLLGDFNTEPHSASIRFLTGTTPLQGIHTAGLYDAWSLVETNINATGHTFCALDENPAKRIDYIFVHEPSKHGVSIVNTTLMDNKNHCYEACSDHLGVVTTLKFRR